MAIGTEEFYGSGGQVERPTAQFRGSEDAYKDATAQGRFHQQRGQEIMEKMGTEKARGIRDYYAPITETIGNLIPAYYGGKRLRNEAEESGLRQEQMQRTAQRDIAYGDQMAKNQMEQSVAQTEATKANTARTVAMTPIEIKTAEAQLANQPLVRQQMIAAIRGANLENESIENQQKIASVAAIINSRRQQGQTPQEQADLEAQALADLRTKGTDESILAKGRTLANTENFNNRLLNQSILNSDPNYGRAQQEMQKVEAGVKAIQALKAQFANVQNDYSVIDSPTFKQGIENIVRTLRESGQDQLADSLERGPVRAILATDSPFKAKRAAESLQFLSNQVQQQIVGMTQTAVTNPHIDTGKLNVMLQQARFDPNAPAGQADIFNKARGGSGVLNAGGIGTMPFSPLPVAGGTVATPGAGAAQAAPPVNLRMAPGARMKMPPAGGKQ